MEAFGKAFLSLIMQSDVMREMRKESALCPNSPRESYGIGDKLVRMMLFFPSQGINDKRIHPIEISQLSLVNSLHIRYIRKPAETITKYRQFIVHHNNRHNLYITNT